MLGSFFVWREEGSVEDVMNFPCRWESKFVCDFGNLSGYLERSVPLWCQFGREIAWESKVRSF